MGNRADFYHYIYFSSFSSFSAPENADGSKLKKSNSWHIVREFMADSPDVMASDLTCHESKVRI